MSYNLLSLSNPIVLADNGIIVDGSGSEPKTFVYAQYKILLTQNINVKNFNGFHSSTDNRLKHQIGYNLNGVNIFLPTCNICKKTSGDIGVITLPLNLRAFYAIIVGGGGGGGGGKDSGTSGGGFGGGGGGCIGQYIELTNKTKQYKLIGSVGTGGAGGILSANPTDGVTGQFSYLMILDNFNSQIFGMRANGGRGGWGGEVY
jgi:hypothetical protein